MRTGRAELHSASRLSGPLLVAGLATKGRGILRVPRPWKVPDLILGSGWITQGLSLRKARSTSQVLPGRPGICPTSCSAARASLPVLPAGTAGAWTGQAWLRSRLWLAPGARECGSWSRYVGDDRPIGLLMVC